MMEGQGCRHRRVCFCFCLCFCFSFSLQDQDARPLVCLPVCLPACRSVLTLLSLMMTVDLHVSPGCHVGIHVPFITCTYGSRIYPLGSVGAGWLVCRAGVEGGRTYLGTVVGMYIRDPRYLHRGASRPHLPWGVGFLSQVNQADVRWCVVCGVWVDVCA